jgi:hypothetical protein
MCRESRVNHNCFRLDELPQSVRNNGTISQKFPTV